MEPRSQEHMYHRGILEAAPDSLPVLQHSDKVLVEELAHARIEQTVVALVAVVVYRSRQIHCKLGILPSIEPECYAVVTELEADIRAAEDIDPRRSHSAAGNHQTSSHSCLECTKRGLRGTPAFRSLFQARVLQM